MFSSETGPILQKIVDSALSKQCILRAISVSHKANIKLVLLLQVMKGIIYVTRDYQD